MNKSYTGHCKLIIYIVLFGPVKPVSGVILSGQENHLSFSGGSIGSEEVLLYFSSGFWFTAETEKQDENKSIILK